MSEPSSEVVMVNPYKLAHDAVTVHRTCQVVEELGFIGSVLLRGKPLRRVLEIGTEFGGTLWYWSALAESDAVIVSLDMDQSKNQTSMGARGQTVVQVQGDSRDPGAQETVRACGPFDFIFIDGDHEPAGVMGDWAEYAVPMLEPHGIVAFHDANGYAHSVEPVLRSCGRSVLRMTASIVQHNGWDPGVAVVLPPAETGLFPEVDRG